MILRYIPLEQLPNAASKAVDDWTSRFEEQVKLDWRHSTLDPDTQQQSALRAPFYGDPFIVSGRRPILDRYLQELDPVAANVLADCAYCWFLTDAADYDHPRLPRGRVSVLNWNRSGQREIWRAAKLLAAVPKLCGLSASADRIRKEILRIGKGTTGPGCSVLILGPSGSGKEVVKDSLLGASGRTGQQISKGGAWLNMEPGMALTELVGLARGPIEERCKGLLEDCKDGALFIDDFESAPTQLQEVLLRIMSVKEGSKAAYQQVGSADDRFTNVWLIFATNRELSQFVSDGHLREDFLFRFGERILVLPPLKQRPADIPAIAHSLWSAIWGKEDERLRTSAVCHIMSQGFEWKGNVRELNALLRLLAALMRDPEFNGYHQSALLEMITSRGRTHLEWIGMVTAKFNPPARTFEQTIREADDGHPRRSAPSSPMDPPELNLTPSESAAKAALTAEGWEIFKEIVRHADGGNRGVPVSVRLARIVWYLSRSGTVKPALVTELTGKTDNTSRQDLKRLAGERDDDGPDESQCALIRRVQRDSADYQRVDQYFVSTPH